MINSKKRKMVLKVLAYTKWEKRNPMDSAFDFDHDISLRLCITNNSLFKTTNIKLHNKLTTNILYRNIEFIQMFIY